MMGWLRGRRAKRELQVSLDTLLAERIACHFEDATVEDATAYLPTLGIRIRCEVPSVDQVGADFYSVPLYLWLSGGVLGDEPIFASISGYESTPPGAVVSGACAWACSFGPVLTDALTGSDHPDVKTFDTTLDGRRFRVRWAHLDRTLSFSTDGPTTDEIYDLVRHRDDGPGWLVPLVVGSGTLPLLTAPGPTLLSAFLMVQPAPRVLEVKVNGTDWPGCEPLIRDDLLAAPGRLHLLREYAVLTPLEPAPALTRDGVRQTLDLLADRTEVTQVAGWRGWRAHGGRLGPPLSADGLVAVESRTGPLPDDYRDFLTRVAASGAGPGYGLLTPALSHGVVPLAHAGCGVTWVLRLDGPHRGEVWVDASGSDESYTRVAGSFTLWYAAWLDAAVRDRLPWAQWDNYSCASMGMLGHLLEQVPPAERDGPISFAGQIPPGGSALFGGGKHAEPGPLDPCHPCVSSYAHFALGDEVFAPGNLSRRPL